MSTKHQPEYTNADEVIDAVMEWIGRRWTKSMIRRELREAFGDITLKTCKYLVYQAKQRIRERYGIDPAEYKGLQISFYEDILRNKAKIADKLKAAERLDKLFGLENIATVDPAALVEKILAFKKLAMQTLEENDDGENKHEGDGEDVPMPAETDTSSESNNPDKEAETEQQNSIPETKTEKESSIEEDMATYLEALDDLGLEKDKV